MASFTIKCPNCGVEMTIQQEWIGMNATCPECQNSFTIPAPTSTPNMTQAQPVNQFQNMNQAQPVNQFQNMNQAQPVNQFQNMNQAQPVNQFQNMNQAQPVNQFQNMNQYQNMNQMSSVQSIQNCNWFISQQDAASINKLFTAMWICFAASILTCGFSGLAGFILMYILLYKFWAVIPRYESNNVTPGKAVGFCFIPFFNLYWIFVAFYQLAKHYQRYTASSVSTFAMIYCCSIIAGFIPFINYISWILGLVFVSLQFNGMRKVTNALAAKNINMYQNNNGFNQY